MSNDFVNWDDDQMLTDNPFYRGLGWPQLRWMFTTFHMGHYQPLSWISFAVDYLIWGMDPFGYHLTNLLLHCANAVLFFFVGRRLLAAAFALPSARALAELTLTLSAALAALLFALHPLRVESVAWATERRDVLSGLFLLATVYAYLRAASMPAQQSRNWWFGAALIGYLLSLLSKAIGITLPVVLILIDVYPLRRLAGAPANWLTAKYRHVLLEKLPFLIIASGFAAAALFAQHITGALQTLDQLNPTSRLLQAGFAFMFYLWKTVFPFNLSPIYELPVNGEPWLWLFVLTAAGTITICAALFYLARRWPAVAASWIYYVVVLAPVTGAAQSGPQLVADRYSYIACLSWPLLIGAGIFRLWQKRDVSPVAWLPQAATAVAMVASIGLAILTWKQTQIWRDPKSLWHQAIASTSYSSIAHYNLGRALERENNTVQAMASYRRAVAANPSYAKAHFNLARLLALAGRDSDAMEHYRRVIEIRPGFADAHNDLGLLLAMNGDPEAARAQFQLALRAEPDHYRAYFNLGELFANQDDYPNAIRNYQAAARINPNEAEFHIRLALALAREGELESATSHLQRAAQLKPNDPKVQTLLARSLAAQGKKEDAERAYQEALRLAKIAGRTGDAASHDSK